jgi:RNA polymerase sigma factor for flagellar operon FliA
MKALRRGIELLIRPERAEALLWTRLRFEQQQEAREPLFNRYAGFARSVASRIRPWGESRNSGDAEQWAYAGLLQAIDSFDPARGAPFRAFAKPRIAGSVRDGFARNGEVEAQWSYRRRRERERLRLLKTSGEILSDDPIEALSAIAGSLAVGLMLDSGIENPGEIPDPSPSAYDSLAWRQLQARLAQEVERLPGPQATVIRQHYLNGLAFAQVATLMGLSRGRISQLHGAALATLRKRISREY